MSFVDTTLGDPFEKLSIFYPMWNEEEYVERALTAGRRLRSLPALLCHPPLFTV